MVEGTQEAGYGADPKGKPSITIPHQLVPSGKPKSEKFPTDTEIVTGELILVPPGVRE